MRIGINALYWIPNAMGGTQTYFLNLIKALLFVRPEDEFCVFLNADGADQFPFGSPRLKIVRCIIPGKLRFFRLAWQYLVLPYYARREKIDVLHSIGYLSPIMPNIPSVVTVLDMIHYVRPREIEFAKQLLWRVLFPLSLMSADRIITISKGVGNEVREHFKWAASKVIPIYLGVDHELFRCTDFPEDDSVPPFVLAVASINPHKNLDGLIRAFAKARQHLSYTRLVLVGMKTATYKKLLRLIDCLGLADVVEFTGRISDQALVKLYQTASVMIFPSFYEGFGLPILEAMACGCPLIASDYSTIREVAGKAAIFVNPAESDELAKALIEVLGNKAVRRSLIEKGLHHVKTYTWEKTAEETFTVYRQTIFNSTK
jgi:glycosyltransferase involved in cell wall biosynthesis